MLERILACPRCDGPLKPKPDAWSCPGCRVDYPLLDGIPFLFAEPAAAIGEWRSRLHMETQRLEYEVQRFEQALEEKALVDLTRRRLDRQRHASKDHIERLNTLLEPLRISELAANYETYLALRTKIPGTQGLNTYYNNVHRDWSWGDEENTASADIVAATLGDDSGRLLVLGAGGCRLAYDLHRRLAPEITVAVDFNPMLMLLARRIMHGEPVELWEFPIAPKTTDDYAVLRQLSAPGPVDKRFCWIIADALRAPFSPNSFDTIVTPWLSDILPEDFSVLCARINRLLKTGGRWINFGSLSFDRPDPAQQYSLEEALYLVEHQGFAELKAREDSIPYMCSPASRHARSETVVTFTATKKSNAKRVPRHQALPDWLVKGDEPVPLQPSFRRQAITTRVHAFVMAMIDGRRSIVDMARLMEEQKLMPSDEAVPVIRSFLIKMLE